MTEEWETLRELNVKPGDVVENKAGEVGTIDDEMVWRGGLGGRGGWQIVADSKKRYWRIVSSAADAPRDRGKMVKPQEGAPAGGYTPGPRQAIAEIPEGAVPPAHQPTIWRDMTPAEKGALLLAHHEGRVIDWSLDGAKWATLYDDPCDWVGSIYIRVKPEPKVETVRGWWNGKNFHNTENYTDRTHIITFNQIDGKPDCASIKMELLE